MKKYLLVIVCVLSAVGATGQSFSKSERMFWLSQVWKDVSDNFYDPDRLVEIGWDSLYMSHIPLVEAAETDAAFTGTLQRFMARVQDGHTHMFDMTTRKPYMAPFAMSYIERGYYIVGWAADRFPGLTLPQEVVSIDGLSVDEYLDMHHIPNVSGSTPQWRRRQALNDFNFSDEATSLTIVLCGVEDGRTTTRSVRYEPMAAFANAAVAAVDSPHKRGNNVYPQEDKHGRTAYRIDLKGFEGYSGNVQGG